MRRFRLDQGDRLNIAVLAVDPSRRKTGGALLGDRIRMNAINTPKVFMRSLATRDTGSAHALRNFLKYRYETPDSRLAYVLLLGDASTDYRNFLGREVRGDVSNALVPALSDRFRLEQASYAYTTDDYFAYMDALDDSLRIAIPDLALGRLPASSAADADQMIDAVIAYERDAPAGAWRNRMVLATDDYTKNCDEIDTIDHTSQAEILVHTAIPPALDLQKIYMCEWDCDFAGFKPAPQNALFKALDEGVLIFNYVGHGGNDVLSDEQLLLSTRLASLANGNRRYLFISASCNVGKYDDTQGRSMSEEMISLASGGAIATMASSDLSTAGFNNVLNRDFLRRALPGRASWRARVPVGAALLRAKVQLQVVDYPQNQGPNNERYAILGDPALALGTPRLDVEFAAAPRRHAEGGGDAGRSAAASCATASWRRTSTASCELSVRASADTSGFERPLYGGGTTHVDYHLPGPEIFRGPGAGERRPLRDAGLLRARPAGLGARRLRPHPGLRGQRGHGGGGRGRARFAARAARHPAAGGRGAQRAARPGRRRHARHAWQWLHADSASASLGHQPGGDASAERDLRGVRGDGPSGEPHRPFEYELGSATAGSVAALLPTSLPSRPQHARRLGGRQPGQRGPRHPARGALRGGALRPAGRAALPEPFPRPLRDQLRADGAWPREPGPLHALRAAPARTSNRTARRRGATRSTGTAATAVGDEVANGTYLYRLVATYADNAARRREETGALVRMRE